MNMNTEKTGQEFKFDVFISYRHSDLDGAAAEYLHKALENYKVPKEIQERTGKKRINRVFRDVEELGASSDLFVEIENSLKASEYLVVILSPRYKESKWCLKEIETFIKYRSRDNILAVIVEGEPANVFPDILVEGGEPLALDLRADSEKQMLKLAKQRLVRLVAPVLGCTYDELYQRHRVARMRRLALIACGAAAVSAAFGLITFNQSAQIRKNYISKQENQSRYLARLSDQLLNEGDREGAMLVALEALPDGSKDNSRPYVAEARIALENALNTYRQDLLTTIRPVKIMEMDSEATGYRDTYREENVLLTIDSLGGIYVWNCEDASLVNKLTGYGAQQARFAGDKKIVFKTETSLCCVKYTDGKLLWQYDFPDEEKFIWDYNRATQTVVAIGKYIDWQSDAAAPEGFSIPDSSKVNVIDAATGRRKMWPLNELYNTSGNYFDIFSYGRDVKISPDGRYVAFNFLDLTSDKSQLVYVYPVDGGRPVLSATAFDSDGVSGLFWQGNQKLISVYESEQRTEIRTEADRYHWNADCYDVSQGGKLWSVRDDAVSFDEICSHQSLSVEKDGTVYDCAAITVGNVFVCIDRKNGTVYNRIEDRSPIVMAQQLNQSDNMLFITQDGYVFLSGLLKDVAWQQGMTEYMYYLQLGGISAVEYYDENTYIFSGSSVHWYQPALDADCVRLGTPLRSAGFSADGRYVWMELSKDGELLSDSEVYLYDTKTDEFLGKGDTQLLCNAAILADRYFMFPSADVATISVYDIKNDKKTDYTFAGKGYKVKRLSTGAIHNSQTEVPVFAYGTHFVRDEEETDNVILWVKDVATGKDVLALTAGEIVKGRTKENNVSSVEIYSAFMSGDGDYLIVTCGIGIMDKDGNWLPDKTCIRVWDVAAGKWRHLPKQAADNLLQEYACYRKDGWIMPGGSMVCLYGQDGVIRIVDLSNMKIVHKFEFGPLGSKETALTPDGDHIVLQDSSWHLKIYNWRQGRYTVDRAVPEQGPMEFAFHQDGRLMSAYVTRAGMQSDAVRLYRQTAPGVYRLETEIDSCKACDGTTTFITDGNYSRFYDYYTFDNLIDMARDVLDGRQLTAAERQTYLID